MALKALKEEHVLGIFPEGTRSSNDEMCFKPGVSMLAIKTKTKILPIYIEGNYRIFGKVNMIFGEPYELNAYYGQKLTGENYERIANEEIAESIRALKKRLQLLNSG
jgi:1-acyl-sn-glycerol-3-phosphate acyltransferase